MRANGWKARLTRSELGRLMAEGARDARRLMQKGASAAWRSRREFNRERLKETLSEVSVISLLPKVAFIAAVAALFILFESIAPLLAVMAAGAYFLFRKSFSTDESNIPASRAATTRRESREARREESTASTVVHEAPASREHHARKTEETDLPSVQEDASVSRKRKPEAPVETVTTAPKTKGRSIADVIPLNNSFAPAWKDIDDFLQATLDVIKTRFAFQTATIFLRGSDKSTFVQRAYVTRTRSVARLAVIRIGHGLVGWVAKNKKPLLVSNLRHEGRSLGYYKAAGEQIASFAAAPILVEDEVVGVIALDHSEPDIFPTPETEEALSAMAALLGRVLGAEETMEKLQQEADRRRESQKALQAAYDAPEIDAAASAVLKELVALADFHALACYLLDESGTPSRRAEIGFDGIGAYNFKEPVMLRAAKQAIMQLSPFRVEGVALAAQYRAGRAPANAVPALLIAYPILHHGEPLGAIVVETAAPRSLEGRLEGILEDISSRVGGAFLRVYRMVSAEGTARVERALTSFAMSLLDCDNRAEIWRRVFAAFREKTGATGAALYRRDKDVFRLEASEDCEPTEETIPENTTLVGWAALAGRPVLSSRHDRRVPPVRSGESFAACPLGGRGSVSEVLVLVSEKPNAFTPESLEWMKSTLESVTPMIRKAARMEEIAATSERDALTGLVSEADFQKRVKGLQYAMESGVIILRVDNIEELHTAGGRQEVNRFLRRIANTVQSSLLSRKRGGGLLAKMDGPVFAIAANGEIGALEEAILGDIEAARSVMPRGLRVSFSAASASRKENIPCEELIDAAYARLFSEETAERRIVTAA